MCVSHLQQRVFAMAECYLPVLQRGLSHAWGLLLHKPQECPKGCRVYIWDLKKRWCVLNCGLQYQDIGVCEKIFVACCCLHNFLLEVMEHNDVPIGHGSPPGNDCMWLNGHTTPPDKRESDQRNALQFSWRRTRLAVHLRGLCDKGPIEES